MSIIDFLTGTRSESKKEDLKLLQEVVENYKPSMRTEGDRMLTMDSDVGRATAKNHGEK